MKPHDERKVAKPRRVLLDQVLENFQHLFDIFGEIVVPRSPVVLVIIVENF